MFWCKKVTCYFEYENKLTVFHWSADFCLSSRASTSFWISLWFRLDISNASMRDLRSEGAEKKMITFAYKIREKWGETDSGHVQACQNLPIGFLLQRSGLQVDNTNKFSHQFFKVAFEMLQMSQGHFARLFFGDVLGVE